MARDVANRGGYTSRQHSFAEVPRAEIQRSVFNRSHNLKTAFNAGLLIPIFVDEALPGDTMRMRVFSFSRMTTPIFPLMDNIFMDFFFFSVPCRLVWDNFQKFNGEQKNPGDSTSFLIPQMSQAVTVESLSDYLGIPIVVGSIQGTQTFNSWWHRAYNLIYNEWFRDENLQNSVVVDTDDGPDAPGDYSLLYRGKRHDYFSSALPFPQKGSAVLLPLGTTAPIIGTGTGVSGLTITASGNLVFSTNSGVNTFGVRPQAIGAGSNLQNQLTAGALNHDMAYMTGLDVGGTFTGAGLSADLSAATAATINQIRQAFQIQRLLERDARGGSRYTEIIRSHFGVVSDDARLQRPEYLGGGSTRINVHPVATTNGQTTSGNLLGRLGAFATASVDGVGFVKSFTEHCLLLGMVNIRGDLTYQEGMPRMFSRQTRYDLYWPALAHLGEQAVLNKEIFAQGSVNPTEDNEVFGYQERYAEYRYKPNFTTGKMRSTATTPLDQWHLGMEFGALPSLNNVFIQDQLPFSRVLAVVTEPQFFGDFFFEYRCARPMPTFGVPGFVDHF